MNNKEQKERMERLNHALHVNIVRDNRNINLTCLAFIVPFFGVYFARKIDDKSYRTLAYVLSFANFMITVFPLVYEQWKLSN